jgi:hypothetical protein
MLIQSHISGEQNQISFKAAQFSSERMDEVFAIANLIYIESVQIAPDSATMAVAIRETLASLFIAIDRVINEKTTKPVEPILDALRNQVINLHKALMIEESDTIRLNKYINRIEMLLAGIVQLAAKPQKHPDHRNPVCGSINRAVKSTFTPEKSGEPEYVLKNSHNINIKKSQ